MVVATVTSTIGNPYRRVAVIEEPAIVVCIDGEQPMSGTPYKRTQEVIGCEKQAVLPVVQNATQVVEPVVVIDALEIGG